MQPTYWIARENTCVDDSDHAAERIAAPNPLIGIQRLRNGCRLGQTGGLDDDGVELIAVLQQLKEASQQVALNRAADTTVVHLHDFVIRGQQQVMVDADLTEFVDDHGNAAAMVRGQDAVEERRFSRSEKPE
jgi:hypothetical protein